MLFNFNSPTDIFFGSGVFRKTTELTNKLGKNPMIVCGRNSMRKFKFLDLLTNDFKKDKKKVIVYDNISSDAKSNEINDAISLIKKKKLIL